MTHNAVRILLFFSKGGAIDLARKFLTSGCSVGLRYLRRGRRWRRGRGERAADVAAAHAAATTPRGRRVRRGDDVSDGAVALASSVLPNPGLCKTLAANTMPRLYQRDRRRGCPKSRTEEQSRALQRETRECPPRVCPRRFRACSCAVPMARPFANRTLHARVQARCRRERSSAPRAKKKTPVDRASWSVQASGRLRTAGEHVIFVGVAAGISN